MKKYIFIKDYSFKTLAVPGGSGMPQLVNFKIGDIIEGSSKPNKSQSEPPTYVETQTPSGRVRIPFGGRGGSLIKEYVEPTVITDVVTPVAPIEKTKQFYKSYLFLGVVIGGIGALLYAKNRGKDALNFVLMGAGAGALVGFGLDKFKGKKPIEKTIEKAASTDSILSLMKDLAKGFGGVLKKEEEDEIIAKLKSFSDKEKQFAFDYLTGFTKNTDEKALNDELEKKYDKDFIKATVLKLNKK